MTPLTVRAISLRTAVFTISSLALLALPNLLQADTIVSQSFENLGDTWNFTSAGGAASSIAGAGDAPPNQRILSGARSWQVTNTTSTLTFDAVDVSAFSSVSVTVRVSSISLSAANGAEANDQIKVFVATNGGAFSATADITLSGNSNSRWGYWATNTAITNVGGVLSIASPVSELSTNNYSTLVVNVPPGVTSVALKITAVNNAANELWCLDDVVLAGTSAGPSGPSIFSHPQSRTNNFGTTATFNVSAFGSAPLGYFWRKNGTPLSNGGNVSGADTNLLTLTGVSGADATGYDVIVSNSINSVTSSVATLTVLDPAITAQPQNQSVPIGSNATFNVTAVGTGLSYQWRMDGTNLSGANATSYTRTAVTPADQAGFQVVVTGTFGSVTSAVASLTVITPQLPTWNFNNTNDSVSAPAPVSGNGTASLLGGVTGSFVGGSTNDPSSGISTNSGWSSTGYPASTANNKSAGFNFAVNTSGFSNIVVRWDQRHSGTASRYTRFQYTVDGSTYLDGPGYFNTNTTGNATYIARTNDLSGISAVNNNPNFAFRIVAEFELTATGSGTNFFVSTDPAGTYGTGGTIRLDYVVVGSSSAASSPPQYLGIAPSGGNVQLTWTNSNWTLQAAPDITGPYTNVAGAATGYSPPATDPQMFFRLTNSVPGQ
ncbi:MAG: hypothetical protein EPO07_15335 [Verrucomicrobia bacterium]|nr:MAG: hypothetical protein EPO07_15335 [Verrucomicrobiota bacterium]